MKTKLYLTVLLLAGLNLNSYAQENTKKAVTDIQKQQIQQRNFYRKTLQVDSAKADQVALVQSNYKAALHTIMIDTSLREEGRKNKIKTLVDSKNQQLRQLLSPAQLEKIIPAAEREPAKVKP